MKSKLDVTVFCLSIGLLIASAQRVAAQAGTAPPAAPAQAQGACGGQANCYESNDFAVIITDFRVSEGGGGSKVIDTTLHFLNKTNQPLILGYTDGSAMAIDDQGNRYGLNGYAGPNAVRGIGRVEGNNIDPKFVLQPGSTADALFELFWRGSNTQGVNYEMDLSIREITPLEGHQFALAGEVPLQFRGLANGISAASPAGSQGVVAGRLAAPAAASYLASGSASGGTGAQPVCNAAAGFGNTASSVANQAGSLAGQANSAAGQKVSNGADSAINSASSTANSAMAQLSSLKSMFGRKKAAAAPTTMAAANPCPPAAAATTPAVSNGFATSAASATGATAATPATVSPQVRAASKAVAARTAPQPAKAVPVVSTSTPAKTAAVATAKTAATAKPAVQKPAPVVSTNP